MVYSGPIDLDALIDLDSLYTSGACHWTFLAFPTSSVNEHGIPADPDAQRYIAAVQSAGVPVGIWRDTPVDGTAYAAVTHETIPQLHNAIEKLSQFPDSFAAGTTVNGMSGRDFQSPLVRTADVFHPAVRDDSSGKTLWFPPLGELRQLL